MTHWWIACAVVGFLSGLFIRGRGELTPYVGSAGILAMIAVFFSMWYHVGILRALLGVLVMWLAGGVGAALGPR